MVSHISDSILVVTIGGSLALWLTFGSMVSWPRKVHHGSGAAGVVAATGLWDRFEFQLHRGGHDDMAHYDRGVLCPIAITKGCRHWV